MHPAEPWMGFPCPNPHFSPFRINLSVRRASIFNAAVDKYYFPCKFWVLKYLSNTDTLVLLLGGAAAKKLCLFSTMLVGHRVRSLRATACARWDYQRGDASTRLTFVRRGCCCRVHCGEAEMNTMLQSWERRGCCCCSWENTAEMLLFSRDEFTAADFGERWMLLQSICYGCCFCWFVHCPLKFTLDEYDFTAGLSMNQESNSTAHWRQQGIPL